MYESYFVYAQKVGTKSFGGKPWHFVANDGIVVLYSEKYVGTEVKSAITKHVNELQESGAYSRIIVKNDERKIIYDWRMEGEKLNVQQKSRGEYMRKRNELKAQIAELKAQLKALDDEWYN